MKPDGGTYCWDAVARAVQCINEFCDAHRAELAPNFRKRILCLSDGEDSGSGMKAEAVLDLLLKEKVVFDSVPIEGKVKRALSHTDTDAHIFFLSM